MAVAVDSRACVVGALGSVDGDSWKVAEPVLSAHTRLPGLVADHASRHRNRDAQDRVEDEPDATVAFLWLRCGLFWRSGAAHPVLGVEAGPAYLIFPIVCRSPAFTIVLSWTILRERTFPLALSGILLSLPAIFLVSLQEPSSSPVHGSIWLVGTMAIFFMWGLQAYFVKSSANAIGPEELFVYMTATGLALSPVALWMGRGVRAGSVVGFGLTFAIQSLNAIGCLLFVYAVRFGKAIVVVPMINGLFPMVTIIVSLLMYREIPSRYNSAGMVLALIAVLFMAFDEVRHSPSEST
jgi:drug/metabolite transporter (DMT)-like permease